MFPTTWRAIAMIARGSKRPKLKQSANVRRGRIPSKSRDRAWIRKLPLVQVALTYLLTSSFFVPPSAIKNIDTRTNVSPVEEPVTGGLTAPSLRTSELQATLHNQESNSMPSLNVSCHLFSPSSNESDSDWNPPFDENNVASFVSPDASNRELYRPPDALSSASLSPSDASKGDVYCQHNAPKNDASSPSAIQLSASPLSALTSSVRSNEGASNEQLSTKDIPVNIKLKSCVGFWYKFCSDIFILDIINNGYKLPFITTPCTIELNNNRSSLSEFQFVTGEITSLLKKGYIKKVCEQPRVINPLSVAYNSLGKKRLILDLRHVNRHLFKFCVKYEAFDVLKNYITNDGFMIKFDLKSGYHHVNIFEEHQTFLGFSWLYNNTKAFFIFTVLPFGLATACNVFTKFMKPLISRWRGLGIKIILYLDDGIVTNSSSQVLSDQALLIKKDLSDCGFSLNNEKCVWQPTNQLEWLGLNINLKTLEFIAPSRKIDKLIGLLNKALNSLSSTPRLLAQLVGYIISIKLAIGPKAVFFTRYMQIAIADSSSWSKVIHISDSIRSEMMFWNNLCHDNNVLSYPIFDQQCGVGALSIYTDASGTGGGGFIKEIANTEVHFKWHYDDQCESSTYRELKALYLVLQKSLPFIKNKEIIWHTDNQNCVRHRFR